MGMQGLRRYQICSSRISVVFFFTNCPVFDHHSCKVDESTPENKSWCHPVAIHYGDKVEVEPSDEKSIFCHGRLLLLFIIFDCAIISFGIEGNG
jgi:hypothetical protein